MKLKHKRLLAGLAVSGSMLGNLLTAYANVPDSIPINSEDETEEDKEQRIGSLQNEMDQLLEEVDRIANYTDMNGIKPIPIPDIGTPTIHPTGGECNVEVSQGQSFSVTIPAFISMNGEKNKDNLNIAQFKTIIKADIAGGDTITVQPVENTVKLSQVGKKDLTANIKGDQKGWVYAINQNDDTEESLKEGVERVHTISVANLSAGRWIGKFDWNITTTGNKVEDSLEHVEYITLEEERGMTGIMRPSAEEEIEVRHQ